MKIKFVILVIFLLTPFIVNSQNGSTTSKYLFSENQVRKLYELKLEYDYLIQANQELWTITNNCDSLIVLYELSEREYNSSLKVKDEIISNTEKMYNAEKEKNNSFDNKISSLKKQNQLFKLTTGSGVVIILLFLIL